MTLRSAAFAAGTLGFALGGFFDGILLHQVLQWHHFLSLVPDPTLADLRAQVVWDGLFHVAVYAIAGFGLWRLWRARAELAAPGAGRTVAVAGLLGFAIWQFVDVAGFHWLVSIHRIRVDVPNPLAWDIGWLVATGLPPLALALWLRRGGALGGGRAIAAGLAVAVLAAAPAAALPAPASGPIVVLFRPGAALPAIAATGARLAWLDPSGDVAAVALPEGMTAWSLYRHGALLVGGAGPGGCLGWTRVAANRD